MLRRDFQQKRVGRVALRRVVCKNGKWSVTFLDLPKNRDLSDSLDPSYKDEALVSVTKCFSG